MKWSSVPDAELNSNSNSGSTLLIKTHTKSKKLKNNFFVVKNEKYITVIFELSPVLTKLRGVLGSILILRRLVIFVYLKSGDHSHTHPHAQTITLHSRHHSHFTHNF